MSNKEEIKDLAHSLIHMSKSQKNEEIVQINLTQYEMGLLTGIVCGVADVQLRS